MNRARTSLAACIILAFTGVMFPWQSANATHIRAGEITVRRASCSGLTFVITITVYTNWNSPIRFSNGGSGEMNFGDGTPIHHPPQIDNSPVPGFGPEYGYASYSIEHTYAETGSYVISYFEHNRNAETLNMFNSIETPFYIDSKITIDPAAGCDALPRLLVPPANTACSGSIWYHNPGAYDSDGDSLSYEMAVPGAGFHMDVDAYRSPNSAEFYTNVGIDYGTANEVHNGPPTFGIDAITGTITWDAPGGPGLYAIAFRIIEWRKIFGQWIQLGYVTRDMQIVVEDCQQNRPALTMPENACVVAGSTIERDIFGSDADHDSVRIEAFSNVFFLNALLTPVPGHFQSTLNGPAVSHFSWSPACTDVRAQPYQIIMRITDKPTPSHGAQLAEFKVWNIQVFGAAPNWVSVQQTPSARKAILNWEAYDCWSASAMQIWRSVGEDAEAGEPCAQGTGSYTQIAELPIGTTQFTDNNDGKGLAPGIRYCYRLIAVGTQGRSAASAEECLSITATAPQITNVSMGNTSQSTGQATIRWKKPTDNQTPPPYSYTVIRAEGMTGDTGYSLVTQNELADTVFIDNALNNANLSYHYRVLLHAGGAIVDSSASASGVRLELVSDDENIQMSWSADVPWGNQTAGYPVHSIYRGPANTTDIANMQWIEDVNVYGRTLTYVDSGQWNDTPLEQDVEYCYCVKTRGSYGTPAVFPPLENFSQIICGKLAPVSEVFPGSPGISVYPNPAIDYLYIRGLKSAAQPAMVTDVMGRSLAMELEQWHDESRVDIRGLPGGMYVVRVQDGNSIRMVKFLKQ